MFYNAENYFDCVDDSLSNDDEFTFNGIRGWNRSRLFDKTERIAKVILAAGKWNPPVFVGLCEIENRNVLEVLTKSATLSRFNYKIIQKDSPDERGIDVAFIYRPDLFHPLNYQTIKVIDSTDVTFKTREILQVSGILNNCDTIHVFVNHWPSRYGGIMETVRYRKLAANALINSIRNIKKTYPEGKIVCAGDFNDTPRDESMKELVKEEESGLHDNYWKMINLSEKWMSEEIQTLKNQYTWEVFDQWIVSDSFLSQNSCYRFLTTEIMKAPFLLEPDTKFGGVKPKRTYIGFKYQDGFSDHLPVLLRIQWINH
jgi:predicted extracellular nuclease